MSDLKDMNVEEFRGFLKNLTQFIGVVQDRKEEFVEACSYTELSGNGMESLEGLTLSPEGSLEVVLKGLNKHRYPYLRHKRLRKPMCNKLHRLLKG